MEFLGMMLTSTLKLFILNSFKHHYIKPVAN
jgi:hypothetical protein